MWHHQGSATFHGELFLPTNRALVVRLRSLSPGTSAACDARVEHRVSRQVVRCHPGGKPMSFPPEWGCLV
jgi:hypothetical protein